MTSQTAAPVWGDTSQKLPAQAAPNEAYHFSPDELRVIKECNRESFYQRSLPIGTCLGLGAFYAVKSGYLKGNARWGPTPKVFAAVLAGYFLGKFSYQSRCAEKMMQLPNSPLGDMLRKRRQQTNTSLLSESLGMETMLTPSMGSSPSTLTESQEYSDHGPRTMDMDLDRPMNNMDSGVRQDAFIDEEPLPPAQSTTTYEELRQKNREEYDKKRSRGFSTLEETPNVIRARPPAPSSTPLTGDQNKYGDTWAR